MNLHNLSKDDPSVMTFRILIFSLLFILYNTSHSVAQIDLEHIKNEITKIIDYDTEIDYKSTPGFAVAIIDGDSSFVFGFGSSHPENEMALDGKSIFEIGSVTKSFTASLITILAEHNILSLDDKVNDHLATQYINPRLSDLTVNDLLTHFSGLPKLPKYIGSKQKDPQNPYADYTKVDLREFYRSFIPEDKIEFIYSHVNYGLLEIIIENATGSDYESALNSFLLKPLRMTNTYIHKSEDSGRAITFGFDRAGRQTKSWDFASFGASEGLKSNLEDLILFTRAHLGTTDSGLDNILALNHEPEVQTHYNDRIYAGKGWHIFNQKKNFNIMTHSGKTYGHRAYISFIKETKTGVIILSNSSVGTEDLGLLILRMINDNWKRKI